MDVVIKVAILNGKKHRNLSIQIKPLHGIRMKTEAFPNGSLTARTDTIPLVNSIAQFSELLLLSLNSSSDTQFS